MQEFIHALLQFPAIFFAGLLGVSLLYWGLVIIGAADLNPFDGADGLHEGGSEAVADAVAGGHDAVEATPLTEALAFLGLRKVPITVNVSVFSLIGWFLAMVTRQGLDGTALPSWASAAAATAVAVVGGFAATAVVSRAIGGLFSADDERVKDTATLVGRVVKVTSEVVDDKRGQGEIDDGKGGIAISIRTAPGVSLARGEEAIVLEHDDTAGTYTVTPQKTLVPTEEEQLAAPVEVGSPARR